MERSVGFAYLSIIVNVCARARVFLCGCVGVCVSMYDCISKGVCVCEGKGEVCADVKYYCTGRKVGKLDIIRLMYFMQGLSVYTK